MQSHGRLGLQHMTFLRDTIQPIVRKWRCNKVVLTSICMESATFTTK